MMSINYLVITAGGLGTRMQRVRPGLPKELIQIKHKPAILYAFQEGIAAGIENIIIVLNPNKKAIIDLFEDNLKLSSYFSNDQKILNYINSTNKVNFVYQNKASGEVGAISEAQKLIGGNPFAVIYPDDLHFPENIALKSLCKLYMKYKTNIVALTKVSKKNKNTIGNSGKIIVNTLDKNNSVYNIINFLPKSRGVYDLKGTEELRACGMMIYHKHTFKYISRLLGKVINNEFTDLILRNYMISRGEIFLGIALKTKYYDIGIPSGYRHCINEVK